MFRGYNYYDNYSPPHPESKTAAASSDLDPVITFAFRGGEAVSTVVRYTKLSFAIFARGYLLVLVHWFRY